MFGMGKEPFCEILRMLKPDLVRPREGENPTVLPALHRFVVYLQFMRTNSFQRAVGTQRFVRVSQSVVCKTVHEISLLLAKKVNEFVKFPSVEESHHIAEEMYLTTGMPAIGIIDGTHIEIMKPVARPSSPAPERYYNRKHYHREAQ
jgi:hypothetical protein